MEIPVVLACDDAFAPHSAATIASLLANAGPGTNYHIHLLHEGLSPGAEGRFRSLVRNWPSATLTFVRANVVRRFPQTAHHLSAATYLRLFIHRLLPFDRVIYLDSDVIILGDLSELFATPMGETFIAAVQSPGARNNRWFVDRSTGLRMEFLGYLERLGLPRAVAGDFYVNAGVLVMNTRAMRDEHLEVHFDRTLQDNAFLVAGDQDVLNACTGVRKTIVDLQWNFQSTLPAALEDPSVDEWFESHSDFAEGIRRYMETPPKVVHFVAAKPWNPSPKPIVYGEFYWKYLAVTPWRSGTLRRPLLSAARPFLMARRSLGQLLRGGND